MFLWDRVARGQGGILCDDMGLGKTVQVIAFLWAVYNKQGDRKDIERVREITSGDRKVNPALVICPASVLYNWEEELDTWGHFSVLKYHKQEKENTLRVASGGRCEVVLTTFESARIHLDDLNTIEWSVVVVDECHKIKEASSGITVAMKNLVCHKRIGLTGTALQNKYDELWCLLDWANPGCLGSRQHFQSEFSTIMTRGFRVDATKGELATAREKQAKLNKLKKAWMIRRTKDKVISSQLPTKTDQVVFCGLSEFQKSVFSALISHPDTKLVLRAWERCPCGKKSVRSKCCFSQEVGTGGQGVQSLLLQIIHIFLKAANHAALLLPKSTKSTVQSSLGTDICTEAFKDHPEMLTSDFRNKFLELSDARFSGKMQVLTGLLETLEKERAKVLLFSHSTTLLNILESFISSRGYSHTRLDGSTRPEIRQQLVREFNSDPDIFIFLISTKAGGLGLNITGANTVIIFDPNWNPSHDLQAQDRAYRIGQTRDVRVFRLVSAGCIEEIIYLRQVYKQQLASASVDGCSARRYFMGVQGDKRRKGELFGIRNLFKVHYVGENRTSCLTAEIESRNREMEKKVRKRSKISLEIKENLLEDMKAEDNDTKDPFKIGLDMDLSNESGVVYTHINQSLVGSSKEEEHISLCAQKEAMEPGRAWQLAEETNDVLGQTQSVVDQETDRYDPNTAGNRARKVKIGNTTLVYGNTPTRTRMKIMKQMAKCSGLEIKQMAKQIIESNFDERIKLMQGHFNQLEHRESVGRLLQDVIQANHSEDNERTLRRISYCNVSSLNSKRLKKYTKEAVVSAIENKLDFTSDDDDLFNAIKVHENKNDLNSENLKMRSNSQRRKDEKYTNIIGNKGNSGTHIKSEGFSDDDDQLIGVLEKEMNIMNDKSCSNLNNPVSCDIIKHKSYTKPAPPGISYSKRKYVESISMVNKTNSEAFDKNLLNDNCSLSSSNFNCDTATPAKRRKEDSTVKHIDNGVSDTIDSMFDDKPSASFTARERYKDDRKDMLTDISQTQNFVKKCYYQQKANDTLDSLFLDEPPSSTPKSKFTYDNERNEISEKLPTQNPTENNKNLSMRSSDTLDSLFSVGASTGHKSSQMSRSARNGNKINETKHETLDDIFM